MVSIWYQIDRNEISEILGPLLDLSSWVRGCQIEIFCKNYPNVEFLLGKPGSNLPDGQLGLPKTLLSYSQCLGDFFGTLQLILVL